MVLLVLVLGAGAVVFLAARRAPEGYEDEDGFHFGIQREGAMASGRAGDGSLVAAYAGRRGAGEAVSTIRVRRRNDQAAFHRV